MASTSTGLPLRSTRVGQVDVLPPTLSLNWHFNPNGMFRPYIGAGINYTMFSGEETSGALAGTEFKLDDSIGAAGQVGVDIGQRNWFFNANVRYIDLSADDRSGWCRSAAASTSTRGSTASTSAIASAA